MTYGQSFCSNPSSKAVREILRALRDRKRTKKSMFNTKFNTGTM
uniref:Uncharacterized protein n=1 Tax=Anguilla anguilla TaxID=7936 RepID=A0A0E9XJM1_ANGAN